MRSRRVCCVRVGGRRRGELVRVHVQDETMAEDEFEWRSAEVRRVEPALANRFQVCVQKRDGTYDEAFLEWFWKDSEGEEWCRAASSQAPVRTLGDPAAASGLLSPRPASVAASDAAASVATAAAAAVLPSDAAASHARARASTAASTIAAASFPVVDMGEDVAAGMDGVRTLLAEARVDMYAEAFETAGYDDGEFVLQLAADHTHLQQMYRDVGMKPGHAARLTQLLKRRTGAA